MGWTERYPLCLCFVSCLQHGAGNPCPSVVHTGMTSNKRFCPGRCYLLLCPAHQHLRWGSCSSLLAHWSAIQTEPSATAWMFLESGHVLQSSPPFASIHNLTSLVTLPKEHQVGPSKRAALVRGSEHRRRCFPTGVAFCPTQGTFRSC